MNYAIVLMLPFTLMLGGCFWATPFGGNMVVQVNNHTDSTIKACPVGDINGDDMFTAQTRDIESGGDERFGIDGFETNPKINVRYKGQKRIYDVDIDFFGYDEVNVETFHFVNGNG